MNVLTGTRRVSVLLLAVNQQKKKTALIRTSSHAGFCLDSNRHSSLGNSESATSALKIHMMLNSAALLHSDSESN